MTWVAFFSGIAATAFLTAGVYFLRIWRVSHDPFFLKFGVACWLITLERVVLVKLQDEQYSLQAIVVESHSWVYLIRLLAFALILFAIIDRNRKKA